MTDRDLTVILVMALCLGLSFLFSGMESGVMALNRLRIRQLMRSGDRRASVLHGYLENPEDFLWTILVGNTLVNFVIFSLGSVQLHLWLRGRVIWWTIIFVVGVFLFYVLFELLPKTLFQRHPNRLTLALARPFRFVHLALAPLVAIVAWCSRGLLRWTGGRTFTGRLFGNREELRYVMQESGANLTAEEKSMINRVFDLQQVRAAHILTPLSKTITVPTTAPVSHVLQLCRERNLTRIPTLNPVTGRVAGIINLETVLYSEGVDPERQAADYVQPAVFLNEHMPVEEALHRMQRSGGDLAVVLDRHHREIGILSMRDILKTIFGEVSL